MSAARLVGVSRAPGKGAVAVLVTDEDGFIREFRRSNKDGCWYQVPFRETAEEGIIPLLESAAAPFWGRRW